MTGERQIYGPIGKAYASHDTVRHKNGEHVRDEPTSRVTTNTIEGFFAGLKRQIKGKHHVVSKKHLHRYVSETEFKYNTRGENDGERTLKAIRGASGKRLTYRDQLDGRGPSEPRQGVETPAPPAKWGIAGGGVCRLYSVHYGGGKSSSL